MPAEAGPPNGPPIQLSAPAKSSNPTDLRRQRAHARRRSAHAFDARVRPARPPAELEAVIDQAPDPWRVVEASDAATARPGPTDPVRFGRLLLLGAGALLAVGIAATLWLAASAGPAREVVLNSATSSAPTTTQVVGLVVDVSGAVARPGVRHLPAGSRVADAIAAAGGFAPSVDATAASATLNLAAPLEDGAKIVVPRRGAASQAGAGPAASAKAAHVDLNTATQAQLEELPGIGPVTAKKIVDSRAESPFRTVDDLTARKLVGPSTFEKIRGLVSIGG